MDVAQFAVLNTAPVSMLPAERLLLYTLVYTTRPRRYVEIGTLAGGSAAIVCAALDARGEEGRMVLVDPAPRVEEALLAHLARRAVLIRGYSPAVLPEAQAAAGGLFDMALVDGDHSYEGTLRDLNGVLPHCANGAYVLCHDCFYPTVTQAIDAFVLAQGGQVADLGPLTRDTSAWADADGNVSREHPAQWGGLRVLQVRRQD
jgi:predicted O-methyltransferase YrrM